MQVPGHWDKLLQQDRKLEGEVLLRSRVELAVHRVLHIPVLDQMVFFLS
jgi:hypothetical protein